MSEWVETTIGKFCPFAYGKALKESNRSNSGEFPVIGSGGPSGSHSEALSSGPTTVIGRKGSVGTTYFARGGCWPIDTTFFVADVEERDPNYTFYLLSSLGLSTMNSDSAVPGLNRDAAHAVAIYVPPLEEQRAIAGVLGALDDKIESNRRITESSRSLIAAEFERTLHLVEGEQRLIDLYSSGDRVVQTGPFGSNLHASDYKDKGVPLILVKHVNRGEIALNGLPLVSDEKANELSSYKVRANDIVVTRVGRVGDAALVPETQEGWLISGQMLRIRIPDQQIAPAWLAAWFQWPDFQERVAGYSVGSTRMSLSTAILGEIPFPGTPVDIQWRFAEDTSSVRCRIVNARTETTLLSALRDALLPALLSGRLRVRDAEKVVEEVV